MRRNDWPCRQIDDRLSLRTDDFCQGNPMPLNIKDPATEDELIEFSHRWPVDFS
jgi:hypothetical protein